MSFVMHSFFSESSRNEYRPIKGIDTKFIKALFLCGFSCRNENRPIKGIDTICLLDKEESTVIVEMRIARLRALTHDLFC